MIDLKESSMAGAKNVYDVGGKILDGIKSICVDGLACIKVKGGERKCFRVHSWVRQGCMISP